jgi:hypothetical protein
VSTSTDVETYYGSIITTFHKVLEGTYEDDVCHLIPGGKELYQKRTIVYGVWSNELQEGKPYFHLQNSVLFFFVTFR